MNARGRRPAERLLAPPGPLLDTMFPKYQWGRCPCAPPCIIAVVRLKGTSCFTLLGSSQRVLFLFVKFSSLAQMKH